MLETGWQSSVQEPCSADIWTPGHIVWVRSGQRRRANVEHVAGIMDESSRTYTTRAAALRTRCSLSVVFFGAPLDPPDSSRHDKHMHATCVTTQSSSCDRRVRRNCLTCRWVPSRVLSNDKLEYVGLQAHEQLQVWWHELLWVSRKDVGTLETHSYSYKHKRNVPVRKFLTFTDTELNK